MKNLPAVEQYSQCIDILVIDDDPVFSKIIGKEARKRSLNLTACKSIEECLGLSGRQFNVIILDYFLTDEIKGTDLAPIFCDNETVVLVSSTSQCLRTKKYRPDNISKFIHKKYGAGKIIDEAVQLRLASSSAFSAES